MDTQLVIVTGMSGAGKSSTAKGLARQCRLNGIPHCWLEEETRNHPITTGEFGGGGLREQAELDRQIPAMLIRWEHLVRRIRRSHRLYILEGVFFQNIIRSLPRQDPPFHRRPAPGAALPAEWLTWSPSYTDIDRTCPLTRG